MYYVGSLPFPSEGTIQEKHQYYHESLLAYTTLFRNLSPSEQLGIRSYKLEHRTKHIALRYFLARELQQRGQLRLAYVASEANTADIFTKALAPGDHQRFCTLLA
ncbi:unnamed protein product [Closterium sp. NIES-53]